MFIYLDTGARHSLYLEDTKTPSMSYLALTKFAGCRLRPCYLFRRWPADGAHRRRVGDKGSASACDCRYTPIALSLYVVFGEVALLSLSLVNLAAAT